jgi:hypothetical protein
MQTTTDSNTPATAPAVDLPSLIRHLRCRAVIAGDLYHEGRITRPEACRCEMDAALGRDTGPIQYEDNTDHHDMMTGEGPDHDEYRRRMANGKDQATRGA